MASRLRGWSIPGWTSVACGLWIAAVFLIVRERQPALEIVVRGTARVSFLLFLTAFAAAGLQRIWPAPSVRWMREQRGYVFLAFTVSHLYHFAAIVALAVQTRGESVGGGLEFTQLLGALNYLAMVAIAAGYAKRRGAEPAKQLWRFLHVGGLYFIWVAFTFAYVTKSLEVPTVVPLAVLALVAVVLRWQEKATF